MIMAEKLRKTISTRETENNYWKKLKSNRKSIMKCLKVLHRPKYGYEELKIWKVLKWDEKKCEDLIRSDKGRKNHSMT